MQLRPPLFAYLSRSQTEIADAIIAELDHFQSNSQPQGGERIFSTQFALLSEPLVGYALLSDGNGTHETYFICRHYTPHLFTPKDSNALYGSYLSNNVGQLMAQKLGAPYAFNPTLRLFKRNKFQPRRKDGFWDGLENEMAWEHERAFIASLRQLLSGENGTQKGRVAQIKVQLPDQAILDAIQDEIFRLPFNRRVRLSGAPGTGKTTVLLKRLSQKTKRQFLTEDEKRLVREDAWQEGQNWMLFTPSDLLKSYLSEALNKELLPAGEEFVKVYSTFRLETLREIGFTKIGPNGFFRIGGNDLQLLKREKGAEHVQLTQRFGEHLTDIWSNLYRDTLQNFNNEARAPLTALTDENQKVLLAALDVMVSAQPDDRNEATRCAASYRKLNNDITALVAKFRVLTALFEQTKNVTSRMIYDEVRRIHNDLPLLTAKNLEDALFPEVEIQVKLLRREVQSLLDALTVQRLFDIIPRAYQELREQPEIQNRFFGPEVDESIHQRTISAPEQDLLLFHALEFVRALQDAFPSDLNGIPQTVRRLCDRMRLIVAIDGVSDFSSLEIACMERLALPRIGGVTISGDLMQRVTRQGLTSWEDMDVLSSGFISSELNISYRQTARLFAMARDLNHHVTGVEPTFRSAYEVHLEDPPPLAVKVSKNLAVDQWLAERVEEICSLHESHLPTTAILVPTGADVEDLRIKLHNRLEPVGIQVDGSPDGNSLGNASRVRIFPVECIKGLEFEAVFYVGFDRMADIHKELIDKYVYVGLSRARSFLGVAYERQFPPRLKAIEHHFINQESFGSALPVISDSVIKE